MSTNRAGNRKREKMPKGPVDMADVKNTADSLNTAMPQDMEAPADDAELMKQKRLPNPNWKLGIGIVALIVVTFLFTSLLLGVNTLVNGVHNMETRASQMKALSEAVDSSRTLYTKVSDDVREMAMEKFALSSSAIGEKALEEIDGTPSFYGDGAIVRVTEDGVECPEGFPEDVLLTPEMFDKDSNVSYSAPASDSDHYYAVYYNPIEKEGPWYYIEWTSTEEIGSRQAALFDMEKSLAGIEKAFDVNILFFPSDEAEKDGSHSLIYHSGSLPDYKTAEEFGITPQMYADAVGSFRDQSTEQISRACHVLNVDGDSYEAFLQKEYNSEAKAHLIIAYLVPLKETGAMIREQTLLVMGAFVLIGVFLLIWTYATLVLVRDHSLSESQKEELSPKKIRRRGISILATGGILILAATALFLALLRLYSTCSQVSASLESLHQRLAENETQAERTQVLRSGTYEELAVQTGKFLEEYPEYADGDTLELLTYLIEVDYLMLFDNNGDETASSADYANVSLGRTPDSDTYDFRSLLQGGSLVKKESVQDALTGKEETLIGVRVRSNPKDTGEEPVYGALLMAIPVERIYGGSVVSTSDIMSSLVSEGLLSFSVDPETHLILNATDEALVGDNALELGLPENALVDGYRDFFSLDGVPYYGECAGIGGTLYYYAAEVQSHIYKNVLKTALSVTVIYFVLMGLYLLFLLFGYRKFFEVWSSIGEVLEEHRDEIKLLRGRRKRSIDPSQRWGYVVRKYGARMPIRMAMRFTEALLLIVILLLVVRVFAVRGTSRTSLITFILQRKWAKGFNLFSITSILILLGEIILTATVTKLILHLISDAMGTKGETICRLLLNLVNYATVIIFAYFALYDLGFRPDTLLASLGLMTFAISLGAKDLITDIIAGLSIVFEGEYQVGDIIDIGGYRGEVLEIGVRTTKLEGRGGNIKIISNRDVKNVVNMTRMNSWVVIEVTVAGGRPIPELEDELEKLLPAIGKGIPDIISGPIYKGVASIGKGGATTLSIIAECNEEDYYAVQRALNRAIQETFEEHDIKIV